MAVIKKLPGQAIIDGFKGTLDYYVHDGIACVRSWPRSPGHDRAPAVQASWEAFAWAAKNWATISQEVRDAFIQMASGTNMTGRDIMVKSYLSRSHIRIP